MARPLRIEFAGALYHITSRGNDRQPIYDNDADRIQFLDQLNGACVRYDWLCHAYCLMTNHVHLVLTPEREDSLARALGDAYLAGWRAFLDPLLPTPD